MNLSKFAIGLVLVATVCALSACRGRVHHHRAPGTTVVVTKTGPPPHAPAHGYRHKHPDGVVLVYKSNLGL